MRILTTSTFLGGLLATVALLAGCGDDTTSPTATEDELRDGNVIKLVVSVDWEGRVVAENNIAAMEAFRAQFPDVPITQFLNAAYYTKDGADADAVTALVERTLLPSDELGLHIHG